MMVYFTVFHSWHGQTPGKMAMGIRVVSNTNSTLSPGSAFLRWVGYLISALPGAAGFLWSVVDKEHCTWHDKLAGTHVIVYGPEIT